MPDCPKCNHYYTVSTTSNFCEACGIRLPKISRTELRKREVGFWLGLLLFLAAIPLLVVGIVLWAIGPSWWFLTESHTIRNTGLGLTAGAVLAFAGCIWLWIAADRKVQTTHKINGSREGFEPKDSVDLEIFYKCPYCHKQATVSETVSSDAMLLDLRCKD